MQQICGDIYSERGNSTYQPLAFLFLFIDSYIHRTPSSGFTSIVMDPYICVQVQKCTSDSHIVCWLKFLFGLFEWNFVYIEAFHANWIVPVTSYQLSGTRYAEYRDENTIVPYIIFVKDSYFFSGMRRRKTKNSNQITPVHRNYSHAIHVILLAILWIHPISLRILCSLF